MMAGELTELSNYVRSLAELLDTTTCQTCGRLLGSHTIQELKTCQKVTKIRLKPPQGSGSTD